MVWVKGLAAVKLPGRMNIVSRRPLIVLDGGHNPGAAHNLNEALRQYFKPTDATEPAGKSILVIGISSDKDIPGIIRELAPVFTVVIATRARSPRSAQPETIAAEFARYGIMALTRDTVAKAIAEAQKAATEDDLICVTGSLYVVGEAIEYLEEYRGNH